MYVYECKHCYLTKTLEHDPKIKKCICCGGKLEKPKKVNEKVVFNFPNNVRKYNPSHQVLV